MVASRKGPETRELSCMGTARRCVNVCVCVNVNVNVCG